MANENLSEPAVTGATASNPPIAGKVVSEPEAPDGTGETESGPEKSPKSRSRIANRELNALAAALLFVVLGFAGIFVVAKVAGVKNGTVLAALLIVPALIYLLLSGKVKDLKGPAGFELSLVEVANQRIPLSGFEGGSGKLSYEPVSFIAKGREATFAERTRGISDAAPVVLTFTLGTTINGPAAANYAKLLTQFRRFKYVAILDSQNKLVSYIDERAFRHMIEADPLYAQELLNDIEHRDVGKVRAFRGMIPYTVTARASIVDTLRKMERTRLDALLVTEEGAIKGIVERDRLANALLLSMIDRASG
ncbi:MAG: CBS domain-containing protein [Solirubrobacteraceae bacterium]